jgi:lipopolysaccharide export system permease protein
MIQAVASIGPREMSSTDVRREIRAKEQALRIRLNERYNKVLGSALELEAALRAGPYSPEWNRKTNYAAAYQREFMAAEGMARDRSVLIYRLEYYKKFSIPFGALSFAFLAVSLGLLAKKSGQTVGFIFGLLIAVMYWALLLGGQTMGMRLGYSPFWSMWFPNILAITVGVIMSIFRIRR